MVPSAGVVPAQDPLSSAVARGAARLRALQEQDGAWRSEYGGPGFLLPMAVAAYHIAGEPLPAGLAPGMERQLRGVVSPDGGVGLHPEGDGTVFTTALTYVALRQLGVPSDDPDAARMRGWLREQGGPLRSAPWGKFMLALLNLCPYEGVPPVLPELWLLPRAAPMHPGRLWCHARQVYLPMAYLYGVRAAAPLDETVLSLRSELYGEPYRDIDFAAHLNSVSPGDEIYPTTPELRLVNRAQVLYERHHRRGPRQAALARLLDHIRAEDRATHDIRIGPVNAVLNTLVHHFNGDRARVRRSFSTLREYLAPGHRGVVMRGYNSTALWDTAFATRALLAAEGEAPGGGATLTRAQDFIRDNQVLEDVPRRKAYFRDPSAGGWPFSDRLHGWPISDCTAEGLLSAVALAPHAGGRPVTEENLRAAARLLLHFQNPDGGWPTYERRRAGPWLERLNPSGVFGGIMVDHSHVECTGSCLEALALAARRFPELEPRQVRRAMSRGERFLRGQQQDEGGWIGAWGVCFTYGTWFAVRGLLAAGVSPDDRAIKRACSFLRSHQRRDGGWGEHPDACRTGRYTQHPQGQAVNTAWALHSLVLAGQGRGEPAQRAAEFLLRRQRDDGDWPREALKGVFNRTTLIDYDNYRRIFPLWALAAYQSSTPNS